MLQFITTKDEGTEEGTTAAATLDRAGARRGAAHDRSCAAGRGRGLPGALPRGPGCGGPCLVVRNGTARARRVTTGAGPVRLTAPRVNDRRVVGGVRQKFTSAVVPPYVRRSPRVESVLPFLYLHGLSTGDFREALPALLGPEAGGLSPSAILRLTKSWTTEYEAFRRRDLADRDYVYLWADGVHFTIRLGRSGCAPSS